MTATLANGQLVKLDKYGYIQVPVDVGLDELVNNDLEGVLDLMSEAACGSPCLMDISFTALEVVGDNTVRFIVTGDPCAALAEDDTC